MMGQTFCFFFEGGCLWGLASRLGSFLLPLPFTLVRKLGSRHIRKFDEWRGDTLKKSQIRDLSMNGCWHLILENT
jgi:hypothetical protein